jgi:hypothetical protein
MTKVKSGSDDLRPEYKRSDFKRLKRGKYYQRVKPSSNVVVLDPDVGTTQSGQAGFCAGREKA